MFSMESVFALLLPFCCLVLIFAQLITFKSRYIPGLLGFILLIMINLLTIIHHQLKVLFVYIAICLTAFPYQ